MLWKEIAKLELLSGSTRIALIEPNRFLNREEPNRRGTDTTRTALRFFSPFLKPNEPKRTAGSLQICWTLLDPNSSNLGGPKTACFGKIRGPYGKNPVVRRQTYIHSRQEFPSFSEWLSMIFLMAGQPTPPNLPLVSLNKALLNPYFWGGVR